MKCTVIYVLCSLYFYFNSIRGFSLTKSGHCGWVSVCSSWVYSVFLF